MAIDDKIRDEKLQYDINKETAKMSALSSGKIDKCEYLTGEEVLPFKQRQIKEQAKYFPLGKAFEKQTKATETSWSFNSFKTKKKNQEPKSTERLFPIEIRTNEIKNETN